jgi:hypothetical protein
MPENRIVLYVNDDPWTLARVFCFAGGAAIVAAFLLVFFMLWRWGSSRKLSASEAARVATNPAESSYVDQALVAHGPAAGKAWTLDVSISDLRDAWHNRDYAKFFTMPTCQFLMWGGALVVTWGASVGTRSWIPFVAAAFLAGPAFLINVFMVWAAFFTKLK